MNRWSILLACSLGLAPVACGPKKPPAASVDTAVETDPKKLFEAGVQILQSPDRKGVVDYQAAYDAFAKAAETDPSLARAAYDAGWTAARLGRVEDAERWYRAALDADSSYEEALLALAELYKQAERGGDAVELYRDYVEKNPDDLKARTSLAEAYVAVGAYDEAIRTCREVLLREPENVGAYVALSKAYFAQGMYDMSLLCAEKALTIKKGDPDIYNNMGVTYIQKDDLPAAIERFKTAVKLDPDHVQANLNLGWLALHAADYSLADRSFEAVTTAEPGNVDALLGLAIARRGLKDLDAAADLYDRIIELDPDNELAYFNAAALHRAYTHDYKKAEAYLDAFIERFQGTIGPDHPVFDEKALVAQAREEERRRKEEEERKKREAEERKKRQMAQLEELKKAAAEFGTRLERATCPDTQELGVEDLAMIVEQANQVIEAEEYSMAGDVLTFLNEYASYLDEFEATCAPYFEAQEGAGGEQQPLAGAGEGDSAEEAEAGDTGASEATGEEHAAGDREPAGTDAAGQGKGGAPPTGEGTP